MAEIAVDLRLTHIYWKGWQAGLRFFDSRSVQFESAVDQFFLTPKLNAIIRYTRFHTLHFLSE